MDSVKKIETDHAVDNTCFINNEADQMSSVTNGSLPNAESKPSQTINERGNELSSSPIQAESKPSPNINERGNELSSSPIQAERKPSPTITASGQEDSSWFQTASNIGTKFMQILQLVPGKTNNSDGNHKNTTRQNIEDKGTRREETFEVCVLKTLSTKAEDNFFKALKHKLTKDKICLKQTDLDEFNKNELCRHFAILICNNVTRQEEDIKCALSKIQPHRQKSIVLLVLHCKRKPTIEFKGADAMTVEMTFNPDDPENSIHDKYNEPAIHKILDMARKRQFDFCINCKAERKPSPTITASGQEDSSSLFQKAEEKLQKHIEDTDTLLKNDEEARKKLHDQIDALTMTIELFCTKREELKQKLSLNNKRVEDEVAKTELEEDNKKAEEKIQKHIEDTDTLLKNGEEARKKLHDQIDALTMTIELLCTEREKLKQKLSLNNQRVEDELAKTELEEDNKTDGNQTQSDDPLITKNKGQTIKDTDARREETFQVCVLQTLSTKAEEHFFEALKHELTKYEICLKQTDLDEFNKNELCRHFAILICNNVTIQEEGIKSALSKVQPHRQKNIVLLVLHCKREPIIEDHFLGTEAMKFKVEMTFNPDDPENSIHDKCNEPAIHTIRDMARKGQFDFCIDCKESCKLQEQREKSLHHVVDKTSPVKSGESPPPLCSVS